MNSFDIFRRRVIQDWRFQIKAFRSVADWTIWLYLILPGVVIFFFMYRSWWEEAPGWIEWMPLSLFFVAGSLYSWSGAFRSFTEEGDKVFLIKKDSLFTNFKKWGFYYSFILQAILSLLAIGILLPFILKFYQLTWLHALCFFIYILGVKYFLIYVKFQVKRIEMKIIRSAINIASFILLAFVSFHISALWIEESFTLLILISLLLSSVGLYLYYPLVKKNSLFEWGLTVEKEAKLKLVNMIYLASFEIEKPKISSRKKPWLFYNSYLIFKNRSAKNGFLELFIKVFTRNSSYILTYFQISSVTSAALIIVPPIWIKVVIFGGFLFMMWIWLVGTWERIVLSHPFAKKYSEHDAYFSAKRTVLGVLFSLSIVFIGTVVGVGLWVVGLFSIFT